MTGVPGNCTLACPHCGGILLREAAAYGCASGHSFDIARQGYVNLLPASAHTGTADTPEMLDARQAVLAGPHFSPLVERVAEAVSHAAEGHPGCIVDVGAGTGEYLAAALRTADARSGVALDISRHACRRSARAHPAITSAVCDAWGRLPLIDGVAAVVMSVFAPRNPEEFARVLAPEGALVIVAPEPDHLGELVEVLGLVTVDADKAGRLHAKFDPLFGLVAEERYAERVHLGMSEAAAIAGMGPSARHVEPEELERRLSLLGDGIDTKLSVTIQTWRKRAYGRDTCSANCDA